MNRFQFVEDHKDAYGVKRLCEIVEIARSSFYAWLAAAPGRAARAAEDTALAARIRVLQDPAQGGDRDTSLTAAETLRPQLDPDEYAQIIRTAPRTNTAIRRTLDELRASR